MPCFAQDTIPVQNSRFDYFTIKDGLSQGLVGSIIQDKEGFMWFATKDGLDKYDGYHVTVYRNNPADEYSLPDNHITKLAEDADGNIWVGTNTKGLYLFDKKLEQFYPVSTGRDDSTLVRETIHELYLRGGKMIVLGNNNVAMYDITRLGKTPYTHTNKPAIKEVFNYKKIPSHWSIVSRALSYNLTNVALLPDNSVWISFPDSIYIYHTGAAFNYHMDAVYPTSNFGFINNNMYGCHVEKIAGSNMLLLNDEHRLVLYNLSTGLVEYSKLIVAASHTGSAFADGDGNFWLNDPDDQYIFNYPARSLKKIGYQENNMGIECVCRDRQGIVWVGTNGFGVLKYDSRKQQFRVFKGQSWVGKAGKNGDLLVGGFNDPGWLNPFTGVTKKLSIPLQASGHNQGYRNDWVADENGVIWMAYNTGGDGLAAYNPAANLIKDYPGLLKTGSWLNGLFLDNGNYLWFVWNKNDNTRVLVKFNKEKGTRVAEYTFPVKNNNYDYKFVSSFWQDSAGIFWFGTLEGLFRFEEHKSEWRQWKNNPADTTSIGTNILFSVCPDPKQPGRYLWIGTNGVGFNRFDIQTGKCLRFTEADGLPNNVVYGILSDSAGNLWLSTNKGLSCFNPATRQFRNFTEDDGLAGNEFNRYEFLKLKTGQLVFGGVDGITAFDPKEVLQQAKGSQLVFTGLSISNRPVSWVEQPGTITAPLPYAKKITLTHDENMFTVSFASLDYRSEKKLYRYYLQGFDKTWTEPTAKNEATYTNLSPATYTLLVKGTNCDGVWNDQPIALQITVLPAWYQTWWFRALVAVMVALGVYGFFRYRLQKSVELVTLRNKIAGDLHDDIGSTLSSISLFSTIIQQKLNGAGGEVKNMLEQINQNTTSMMEAMSDIVWTINSKNDSFISVINRMRAFAVEIMEPLGCEVHFTLKSDVEYLTLNMVQRKNLYLLFKEAVNNAAKYAACKNVWVEIINYRGKKLVMTVRDDGIGFLHGDETTAAAQKSRLFGGNGIPSMQKRCDELRGKLHINSIIGTGTTITVEFSL